MKWHILMAITLSLASATLCYADEDRHRFPMDFHDLGLTSKQHKEVQEAMKEYQHDSRRYHAQSAKIQQELNALFLNPTFDEESFRAKNIQMQRSSVDVRSRLFSRLHKILTPQQKQRFILHIEEWEIE